MWAVCLVLSAGAARAPRQVAAACPWSPAGRAALNAPPPERRPPRLTSSVFANFSRPLSLKHCIKWYRAFIKYISHNNRSRNNNNNTFHSTGPFLLRISGCFTNINECRHATEGYFPLKQKMPLSVTSGLSLRSRAGRCKLCAAGRLRRCFITGHGAVTSD